MKDDPKYLLLLEKLGFNTTRLRWKLYKLEQRRERVQHNGLMPERMRWLQYGHKICRHCGAVNDRSDPKCCRCEKRLPSLALYRLSRFLGFMVPEAAPTTVFVFMALCALFFSASLTIDGFSALLSPGPSLALLGAWSDMPETGMTGPWRILTFGLIHGGILHIAFNIYAMINLGGLTEGQLGPKRTLVLITIAQIGAALGTWVWYVQMQDHGFLTVGASGWVSGLLGYAIAYFYTMGRMGDLYRRQLTQWAVYILLFGYFMGANNAAHIGGFVAGAALGAIADRRGRRTKIELQIWEGAFWLCAGLWLVAIALQILFLLQHIGESAS
ncbi:MAG: rhomboid family intramembrane serine protease [Candidatus Hydrogenedentes bacterium]|nr:rhomboid family intramembrane serine protease [Candidatus Hydrogenedentota bacterium]